MKQRPRIHYAESQKALMWERWQRVESIHHTQLFDRWHSSLRGILVEIGGIRPARRLPISVPARHLAVLGEPVRPVGRQPFICQPDFDDPCTACFGQRWSPLSSRSSLTAFQIPV